MTASTASTTTAQFFGIIELFFEAWWPILMPDFR